MRISQYSTFEIPYIPSSSTFLYTPWIHYVYNFNGYYSGNMYVKAVQAEAAERRDRNNDSDTEKGSNVQRWGVPPSSTIHVVSNPSSYDELYFMSAIPLIEYLTFNYKEFG